MEHFLERRYPLHLLTESLLSRLHHSSYARFISPSKTPFLCSSYFHFRTWKIHKRASITIKEKLISQKNNEKANPAGGGAYTGEIVFYGPSLTLN